MKKQLGFFFMCGVLLTSALTPASAQGLCSGRCLVNPVTFQPFCSLSLFGHVICIEGQDFCAEFECQGFMAASPESLAAGEVQPARTVQCRQASSALLPTASSIVFPPEKIQVIVLKART